MPEATPAIRMAFRNNCIEAAITQPPGYLYSGDARQGGCSMSAIRWGRRCAAPPAKCDAIRPLRPCQVWRARSVSF